MFCQLFTKIDVWLSSVYGSDLIWAMLKMNPLPKCSDSFLSWSDFQTKVFRASLEDIIQSQACPILLIEMLLCTKRRNAIGLNDASCTKKRNAIGLNAAIAIAIKW